ncbi:protein of unknown function [Aminobacter niigataensis]|nr:protein of unknown function [Aminobacter niigataensis]
MLRNFLTDWTNVSTAASAVKGLLPEMRLLRRAPQVGKNWSSGLVQMHPVCTLECGTS